MCHETSQRPVIRRARDMPRALAVSTDRPDSMANLRQRTYSAVDGRMEVCHGARRYPHAGVRWTSLHDFLQSGDDHGHVRGVAGVRTSLSGRSLQRTMPLLEIIWSGSTQPSSHRVFLHLVEGSLAYAPNRGDLPHVCVQSTGSKLWQRLCLVGVGYKTCWSVACARRTSRVSSLFFAWNRQRGASARLLQSFTHRASVIRRFVSYSARSHKSPQSSPYSTRNMSLCSRPMENAAHSAPGELLTTRRIFREFQASTETVEYSPRTKFGCAAMIT